MRQDIFVCHLCQVVLPWCNEKQLHFVCLDVPFLTNTDIVLLMCGIGLCPHS